MRIIKQQKAVSTLVLILLILASLVIGAFLSYLWVMASFYNMPKYSTLLAVENVNFPQDNFTYFNVEVLNPSNSVSDANITAFRINLEELNQTFTVETADPTLPFLMKRGTRQNFKCQKNWSSIAGENVTIEPISENASIKSSVHSAPKAKLKLTPSFNASKTVENFTMTVDASESNVTLTVSQIKMFTETLNVTPSLPRTMEPNSTIVFTCSNNWESRKGQNVTFTLKTVEGYETSIRSDTLPLALLYIEEIKFDYDDTSYFNLTIRNSETSDTNVALNRINITTSSETITLLQTDPPLSPLPTPIPPNTTLAIKCMWNWTTYRNSSLTVEAYTKQGFVISSTTVKTPPSNVWNMTDVSFDLDNTGYFSLKLMSMPCSLGDVTIATVQLNDQNVTSFSPSVIPRNSEMVINCTLDWKNLRGNSATVTVIMSDGSGKSRAISIPSATLKLLGEILVYGNLTDNNITIPYVNITVLNSANSIRNLAINRITIETGNKTYEIDDMLTYPKLAPNGYTLTIGQNVTITCLWDYSVVGTNSVKVTVYTSEGIQTSRTWFPPT